MAKSNNNVITHGMTGTLGDTIVFRQLHGKTIVAAMPRHSDKPASKSQQAIRANFQQAVIYGKAAMSDAATKAAYQSAAQEGQSAFNVAVADFFHAPRIDGVDLSGYTGAQGDKISIHASDDFMVVSVHVRIENSSQSLIEEGNAIQTPGTTEWIYTTTQANASFTGDKITITASDVPGHHTTDEHIL